MARSVKNSRISSLPQDWILMTAAGVASVGLACGLAQPAVAGWWKLSQQDKPSATTRSTPAENGFAATIRRLQAESRRAAERGDHAKALQLAERAAKISEAAAQVAGPAADVSPQETSRFVAEMRARRDLPPANVAAVTPAAQAPAANAAAAHAPAATARVAQAPITRAPITRAPDSRVPAARVPAARVPAVAAGERPLPALPPAPVATPASAVESIEEKNGVIAATEFESRMPLFGAPSVRRSDVPQSGAVREMAANPRSVAGRPDPRQQSVARSSRSLQPDPVPPSPTRPQFAVVEELLAQSRLAAANDQLGQAIDLAEQAVVASQSNALFGPVVKSSIAVEARRWRDMLIDRERARHSSQVVAASEAPATSGSVGKPAAVLPAAPSAGLTEAINEPLATAEDASKFRGESFDSPEPGEVFAAVVDSGTLAQSANQSNADVALWTEDLPDATSATADAPVSRIGREPIKFSRAVISRSGNWTDDEFNKPSPNLAEPSPTAEDLPAQSDTSVEASETPAEFPLGSVSTPGFDQVQRERPPIVDPEVTAASTSRHQSAPSDDSSAIPRRSIVLRGDIQLVSAERPATSGSSVPEVPASESPNPAVPAKNPAAPAIEAPESTAQKPVAAESDAGAKVTTVVFRSKSEKSAAQVSLVSNTGETEQPAQRFPVQRVLQLRRRLESAGAAAPEQPPVASQPSATPPQAAQIGGWRVIESSADRVAATARPAAASESAKAERPGSNLSAPSRPAEPRRRPALKLRPYGGPSIDAFDPDLQEKSIPQTREPAQPSVGHSRPTLWQSVQEQAPKQTDTAQNADPADSQPDLTPPISQAGFESTVSLPESSQDGETAGDQVLPSIPLPADIAGATEAETAPPPPADESTPWFRDESVSAQKSSSGDVVVYKSSFAMIDRLAEAFRLPVATLVSLIGGGGLALVIGGLIALRSALKRRYS